MILVPKHPREFGCKVAMGLLVMFFLIRLFSALVGSEVAETWGAWYLGMSVAALASITLVWMLFCRTTNIHKSRMDTNEGRVLAFFVSMACFIGLGLGLMNLLYITIYESVGDAISVTICVGFMDFAAPIFMQVMLHTSLLHNLLWLFAINAATSGAFIARYGIDGRLMALQTLLATFVAISLCAIERSVRKSFLRQIRIIQLQGEQAVLKTLQACVGACGCGNILSHEMGENFGHGDHENEMSNNVMGGKYEFTELVAVGAEWRSSQVDDVGVIGAPAMSEDDLRACRLTHLIDSTPPDMGRNEARSP
jgi:hypothetical protein